MAGSTRAELAASGLDGSNFGSAYPNGQRGSYSGSSSDRAGSFREGFENRMLGLGTMSSRNAAAQMEPSVTQHMSLEPLSTNELKTIRSGELRRVLGIPVEDHTFGSLQSKPLPPVSWEELKRFRASVEETWSKAKERRKLLQDSILKLDKVRSIFSKKRQRNEFQSNEKASNSTLLKIGSQMHQNSVDLAGQGLEERSKNSVPNKRIRSSMAEVRASSAYSLQPEGRSSPPVRQSTLLEKDKGLHGDKDKSMLRACNGVPMPIDDKMRGLPGGGDGWDKKMKRKRSVGTMVNRTPLDGDRELKQSAQQRPNNEPRSRSGDAPGYRTGIMANNKVDSTTHVTGGSSNITQRNDLSNGSLSIDRNDRRDRSSGVDKERVNPRGNNKLNPSDDAQLCSQIPLTKGKAARAPRTGCAVVINSANIARSSGGIDEQPSCLNKVQTLTGPSNRKRPLSTESSSPPVARWGGQRREKISRTRRANVVSPVSNFDDTQVEGFMVPEAGARLSGVESSGMLYRSSANNTHLKVKVENVPSPVVPSESEESIVNSTKFNEKGTDDGEVEDRTVGAAHKATTFVLPTKNDKAAPREDIGDGVRRQGRSGRGSVHSKAGLQLSKEKLENLENSKQLKSGRLTSEKFERIGRPPSKKGSDRKSSTRSLQIISRGSELAGESDDDREELLAAAIAVRNATYLENSGPFWKEVELFFSFVSSEDLAPLKNQINFAEELSASLPNMLDVDSSAMAGVTSQAVPCLVSQQFSQTNIVGLSTRDRTASSIDELQLVKADRWSERITPLAQRLLSAFISEDGTDMISSKSKQGDTLLQFSSDASPYSINSFVENEQGSGTTISGLEFDNDSGSHGNCYEDNPPCNGFVSPTTTYRILGNFLSGDELLQENSFLHQDNPDTGALSEFEQDKSELQEPTMSCLSDSSTFQCQYEHMLLDDKILMELHSIGIYPDAVPDLADGDDNEIDRAISELKTSLYQQVWNNKSQLCNLEKVILEKRKQEMRNREQLAMDRLVVSALKKLMGGRGNHGSSHKSGASKVSKQLALAFAKRTLARCRKFEETGKSCFSESFLQNALFSQHVLHSDAKSAADEISFRINPNPHVGSHSSHFGSRQSAFGVSSNLIEGHDPIHKIDRNQLDPYHSLSYSDQNSVRKNNSTNRGKKREVLLDEVITGAALRITPSVNSTLQGGTKWNKVDKDHNLLLKNSAPKANSPSLSIDRGDRKTKTKLKQKIVQSSTSGSNLDRVTETTKMLPSVQGPCEILNSGSCTGNSEEELASSRSSAQDLSKETEDNIFTNLPLQGIDSIDELDVADGLGDQGQDIGLWLNVDDDSLLDNDLVGLDIPMDDISELKLSF